MEDPEIVIVPHAETGEPVRLRKSFHGAALLTEDGSEDASLPPVDQNDYDIPETEVDETDVHLATLSKKFTRERVRVKRKFRGAKIVDLERRSDLKPL